MDQPSPRLWDRLAEAIEDVRRRTLGAFLDGVARAKARRDEAAFSIALIALSAKMAKADGVVTDDEIAAFRKFFQFPAAEASKVRMIYDLAKQDIAGFEHYAAQVARAYEDERAILEDVLDCLYYVAQADGVSHPREEAMLDKMAEIFALPADARRRIRAVHFGHAADDPWLILGIEPAADLASVKARYRNLMRENHPDALIARGVPAHLVRIAENRTAAINAAYEKILASV